VERERPSDEALEVVSRASSVVSSWISRNEWLPVAFCRVEYDEPSVIVYATEPLPADARTELEAKIAPARLIEIRSAYNSGQLRAATRRLMETAPKDGPYAVTMAGPDHEGNGIQVSPCYPITDEAEFRRHLTCDLPLTIRPAIGPVYPAASSPEHDSEAAGTS
jgi:hypothetical protein